jgi:hypothetical protein
VIRDGESEMQTVDHLCVQSSRPPSRQNPRLTDRRAFSSVL